MAAAEILTCHAAGVILLLATGQLTFSALPQLALTLSNTYGAHVSAGAAQSSWMLPNLRSGDQVSMLC